MMKDKLTGAFLGAAMVVGLGASFVGIASANTHMPVDSSGSSATERSNHGLGGVMGTVSAVNGNILTVVGKNSVTYTVDVTNAKVTKIVAGAAPTTVTVSNIAVGDTVGVRGTVSGTTVTATAVMDGIYKGRGDMKGEKMMRVHHGVAGTITAINGNTITIKKADGAIYTVDASSAAITKVVTLTVAGLSVGDTIHAQGTVSGTTVTASHIMDGVPARK